MIPLVQTPPLKTIAFPGLSSNPRTLPPTGNTLSELLPHFTSKERQFFERSRFKALYGGRAARKSHTFAELMLARMVLDPALQCVVIRRYRASLTYSAKLLLENKVRDLGWEGLFEIQGNTIRRRGGTGFIAFTGMQDHNATSIKSYENFGIAWGEEATEIDQYSLDLLVPTLRAPGSELWFSWNPDQPTDPVDAMFRVHPPQNAIIQQVSFRDNAFLSDESRQDEQDALARDPEKHSWIWLGNYNVASNQIIFAGRWRVGEVDTTDWDGPYFGADFGFVVDPTAVARQWRLGDQIYIEAESYRYGLQIDRIAGAWIEDIPGVERHVVRADSAEQKTIDYIQRHGIPRIVPAIKGPGSVETGVKWLKSHTLIVHPDCLSFQEELKRYRLKTNKAGDVLDEIVDKDNHLIDQCIEHGQLVATERGDRPIQNVKAGDKVWTRKGLRTVLNAVMTSPSRDILELTTSSGKTLRGTANHLVFVSGKGFIRLDELRYNDEVLSIGSVPCLSESLLNTAASCGIDTQDQHTRQTANILSELPRAVGLFGFIGKYGLTTMGQFPTGTKFTTKTKTQLTITSLILNALILLVTRLSTRLGAAGRRTLIAILTRLGHLLKLGIDLLRATLNTVKTPELCGPAMLGRLGNANTAGTSSQQKPWAAPTNIAPISADQQRGGHRALMMSAECAKSAKATSLATNTQRADFVLDRVLCVSATGQRNKVYDLTVDDAEEFFASSILVHNCRYAFEPLIQSSIVPIESKRLGQERTAMGAFAQRQRSSRFRKR